MRIARQSEQFGLPTEVPGRTAGKSPMPTDPELFSDLLRGPRIQAGLLRTEERDEE